MCNQCNDIRRIHQGSVVYGVFHNGRMQMVNATESQAIRSKELLDGSNGRLKFCNCKKDDECVWEVFQIDRKSISWET